MTTRPSQRLPEDRISLPPAARLSMSQFSDGLRRQGYIIEELTDDHLLAQAPATTSLDLPIVDAWFPRARIAVQRSEAGLITSHHLPVRRILATNLFSALALALAVPGTLRERSILAAATVLLTGVFQWRSTRRRHTLLTFDAKDKSSPRPS